MSSLVTKLQGYSPFTCTLFTSPMLDVEFFNFKFLPQPLCSLLCLYIECGYSPRSLAFLRMLLCFLLLNETWEFSKDTGKKLLWAVDHSYILDKLRGQARRSTFSLAPYCFFPLISLTNDITPSHWDLWPCLIFDLPHYCHWLTFWSLLLKFMGVWPLVSYKLALHPDFCQNLQGFQKVNISHYVASWFLGFLFITTWISLHSISTTPLKRGKMKTLITIWVV